MRVSPLNITHVVESLDRGGLERVVCDLAQEQLRAGHRVAVVCLFRDGLLAEEARRAGALVIVIGKQISGIDLSAWIRLRRVLRASGADVIHTHNATAHYHAALAGAARGRLMVNTRHGMGGSRAADRRERLFALTLGKTKAVVAVCQAAANRFVEDRIVPAGLIRVVPNGIRVQAFGERDPAAARRCLELPCDALVVGTVGRLNWAKDHPFLLQAFRELRRNIPNAFLVIIGEGELRAELQRLAGELGLQQWVRFAGDRSDVALLLPGMDIFALSSRTEGYSIALLEACAAGVPIVATRVGGNAEIVQDRTTGFLVGHGDVAAFTSALQDLAGSGAMRGEFGSRAREWALENASLEVMSGRYERMYLEFVASAAPWTH